MNNKQEFDNLVKIGVLKKEDSSRRVKSLVDMLIEALFVPTKDDLLSKVDKVRIEMFGIDGSEPINWGDLKTVEVKPFEDGSYLVTIDEAAPNACPTLCSYIAEYMAHYGWTVSVETEW